MFGFYSIAPPPPVCYSSLHNFPIGLPPSPVGSIVGPFVLSPNLSWGGGYLCSNCQDYVKQQQLIAMQQQQIAIQNQIAMQQQHNMAVQQLAVQNNIIQQQSAYFNMIRELRGYTDNHTIKYSDVTLDKKLGEGSFGVVYKATWKGKTVALKKIKVPYGQDMTQIIKSFNKEREVLSSLEHENCVSFIGSCSNPLCLVTEFLENGDLASYMKNHYLDLDQKVSIAIGITKGLQHLHKQNPKILHHDLKAGNILLDENLVPKIADFGCAKLRPTMQFYMNSMGTTPGLGTIPFMAPEFLQNNYHYTAECDIYSLGMVFYELFAEQTPFENTPMSLVIQQVLVGERPSIPHGCPASHIIKSCWHQHPSKRMSLAKIIDALQDLSSSNSNS